MLLMVEKGIRDGIWESNYRYAKGNNKYMKNYDNIIESSYIEYLDANDDKMIQTYDKITTYPYEANAFKVCESEILSNKRFIP